jgi:hypothetical protein
VCARAAEQPIGAERQRELSAARLRLQQQAHALTHSAQWPIDPVTLARANGTAIAVERRSANAPGSFVWREGRPVIVLRRATDRRSALTGFERFTVAHELAHWLIERDIGFRPQSEREYWALEDICQGFAHALLLPQHLVHAAVPSITTANQLLLAINDIANRAAVTPEPAARAVVACTGRSIAVGLLQHNPHPTTRRLGFRRWWCETRHWLGGGGHHGIAVREGESLADALATLPRLDPGSRMTLDMTGVTDALLRRHPRRRLGAFVALLEEQDRQRPLGPSQAAAPSKIDPRASFGQPQPLWR